MREAVNKKYLTASPFSYMIAKVIPMEKFVEQTMLYDFYGELLTSHQRSVYEQVVFNDMSYSEAAEEYSVSRQGIHDLVKRCNRQLEEYESKLHLLERYLKIRDKAEEIARLTEEEPDSEETYRRLQQQIHGIAVSIVEEL